MRWGLKVGLLVAALAAAAAAPASAVTITEFDANPKSNLAFPVYITAGPEGNLWWTDIGVEAGIARMTPNGERLPRILDENEPIDVVVAPSGWASWVSENGFGSRSPGGSVTKTTSALHGNSIILGPGNRLRWGGREGSTVAVVCRPADEGDHFVEGKSCGGWSDPGRVTGLAESPAGVLWAAFNESDRVRIFDGAGNVTHTVELPVGSGPVAVAIGPEGNAWVTMWTAGAVDRITPDGIRTRFMLPAESRPNDIVLGPDGAFWITESGTGMIGRLDTAGVLTNEYPIPSGEPNQIGIAVGPDGNIWFTDPEAGKIGRLVPDPLALAPGPAPADTEPPRFLGTPAFSPSRFSVAGGAKAKGKARASRGAPRGSKLKFTLSEASRVTATIARRTLGRKSGRKCVAPGKAKPGAAKCSRYVKAGTWSASGRQGANKVPFSGKLKGKALAPGAYRATLSARDGAGNVSTPKTASFTIVR